MNQNRKQQIGKASERSAQIRTCPECGRSGALGSIVRVTHVGSFRRCRYCGHTKRVSDWKQA